MFPSRYTVFKTSGCAQFTLLPPKVDKKGYISKEGAILLEAAPGNGDRENPVMDWSNKIIFAIGLADIAMLIDQTKENARILHDHNGTIKVLQFRQGEGKYEGTYMMNLSVNPGKSDSKDIRVPFTNGEWNILLKLLAASLPIMIGWVPSATDPYVQDKD